MLLLAVAPQNCTDGRLIGGPRDGVSVANNDQLKLTVECDTLSLSLVWGLWVNIYRGDAVCGGCDNCCKGEFV